MLTMAAFGVFYLMIATGGASFIHECNNLVCGQLHQAIFAAVGAIGLFVAVYRFVQGKPAVAEVVFVATLPILIVHVLLVITDPNEAIFFPLSTTPPPLVSGLVLLMRRVSGGARSGPAR